MTSNALVQGLLPDAADGYTPLSFRRPPSAPRMTLEVWRVAEMFAKFMMLRAVMGKPVVKET